MKRANWKRLAVAAFVLADGASASAAVNVCTDLQTRLDALDRTTSTNSGTYATYDAQVKQQQAAIDKATNDARSNGCYGGFFSPKPSAQCPQMLSQLNTMQANLAKLTSARDQYRSDPYTLASQRNDIIRLQQQNRCSVVASATPPQPATGGFFASLFGGFTQFGNGYYSSGPYYGSATYRTLCVRPCDGYYFPISFETTPDQFSADEQSCEQLCPGASLYVHHNPGEDIESMVSLSGGAYSSLPSAYKYRTSYDAACTCAGTQPSLVNQLASQAAALTPGGVPGVTTISVPSANATFTPTPVPQGPFVPLPVQRPSVSEDPETLADRAGKLIPAQVGNAPQPQLAGLTPDGRRIRVIAPDYYAGN